MKTPFVGPMNVSRSTNFADNQSINLIVEIAETKDGKEIAYFYEAPGLTLDCVAGTGPIRGKGGLHVMAGVLYIVSGNQVWTLTKTGVLTLIGTILSSAGSVSTIDNGTQLVIFDGTNGFLAPAGYFLTGGAVGAGGVNYGIGDTINLAPADGSQVATAVVTVLTLTGSAVATFAVTFTGSFPIQPTSFTQLSSSGSGTGFTLTTPTYSATTALYQLTLPFSSPTSANYQDGFGLCNQAGTNDWFQSNLFDLSIWQALNFSSADAEPDNIMAIGDIYRQVYLLKQTNTEVWVNAGLPGFAFQRVDGVLIEVGCVAPYSVTRLGESIYFLSQNSQGQGIVKSITGYQPNDVSPQALVNHFASFTTISDAIGYAYQQSGHTFYVLVFPTADETWVLDVTASALAGVPMWHQRAAFDNGEFHRHWSNAYAVLQPN